MAQTREIEKLQRRWQENPLGLTFAPLAEAYRKEGMFADALELLEIGLSQHPNYVPAHIVRGRCYLDTQSDGQAESAFVRVTELDPENVIALKGLAEIAERSGRLDEAVTHLDRLLDFDRNNDEAREQLDRIREELASRAPADAAPPPPPPAPAPEPMVAAPAAEATFDEPEPTKAEIIDLGRTPTEIQTFQPVELTAAPASEFRVPNDSEQLSPASASGGATVEADALVLDPSSPPFELASPVAPTSEVIPESAEPEAPPDGGIPLEPAPVADAPEPSVAALDESPWQADQPEPPVSEQEVPGTEPPGVELVPPPEEEEPDLVVTETMAEVFLRQGHRELALAVYSQLLGRDPENPRIRGAVDRLQAELKPDAPAAPSLPVYAAVLTGGQSVRSFFETLLAATRPSAGAAPGSGLSLGAVFGDEAAAAGAPAPADSGESFDEFFGGSEPEASSQAAQADHPADGSEDIEDFNSWLRGLKR